MKILLLGGTGAMGGYLANLLCAENIETYITSRKKNNDYGCVHYITGNAHDDKFLYPLLQNHYDVIVDFMVYTTVEFKKRAEKILENCNQYVFLSSARVYADSKTPITEESPRLLDVSDDSDFLATDDYALKKAREEDILRNSNKKNWTVIRPYITYSDIRLQFGILEKELWLSRALSDKTVVFSKDIFSHRTTLTWGEDVARGIKAVIGREEALGECFHITSSESLLWSDVWNVYQNVISEIKGFTPEIKLVDLQTFNKIYPSMYSIKYDRLYNRVFDNSKINKFINSSNFMTPQIGLKKSLQEFIENGACFNFPVWWRSEGYADRITGNKVSLKTIDGIKNKFRYMVGKSELNSKIWSFFKKGTVQSGR